MSEAKFKLTAVCGGCRWLSSNPKQACGDCGDVICPMCGCHCVVVAAWPGEREDDVGARQRRQLEARKRRFEDDGDVVWLSSAGVQ